jgi:deferrochelatase/peroxidase EfeB
MTLSRRRLFGVVGAGAAVAGAGAAAGVLATEAFNDDEVTPTSSAGEAVPFHGRHQAGIVTPAQDRMHFVSLDVRTRDRAELVQLLKDWTRAAERMTRGLETKPDGAVGGPPEAAPADTGAQPR